MRDGNRREGVTADEQRRAGSHLEDRLGDETDAASDGQRRSRGDDKHGEERAIESRQSAIRRHVRRKELHRDRNHDDADRKRHERCAPRALQTRDAQHDKHQRVPHQLLGREVREVTRGDAPERTATLPLEVSEKKAHDGSPASPRRHRPRGSVRRSDRARRRRVTTSPNAPDR